MTGEPPGPARLQLAALPSAPSWACRFLVDVLHKWDMDELAPTAGLVASEIVEHAAACSARPDVRAPRRRRDLRGLCRIVVTVDLPTNTEPSPDGPGAHPRTGFGPRTRAESPTDREFWSAGSEPGGEPLPAASLPGGLHLRVWSHRQRPPRSGTDPLTGADVSPLPLTEHHAVRWGVDFPPCGGVAAWVELTGDPAHGDAG